MYNFVDTIKTNSESVRPSEALYLYTSKAYIEDLIPGYRTLNVTGREALSPVLDTFESGIRDGAKLKSKRYPERTIIVKYLLTAESNEAFRDAYNKLGEILDVKDVKFRFYDESDKYFTGTPSLVGEVTPGTNSVVGEIHFLCVDPFKYSRQEYTAEANTADGSVLINYEGTYKSFPILQAEFYSESDVSDDGESTKALTGHGDCGYVAFFNENKKIIQMGNPDEADSESYAKSQTLMNQSFKSTTSWGKAAAALWTPNNGKAYPTDLVQTGSVTMGTAKYTAGPKDTSGTLIKVRTTTGSPLLTYSVTAKTTDRTASSVKVAISITANLSSSSSGIGKDRQIDASVRIGGSWHGVTLKKKSVVWEEDKSYTANLTVTVTGLSADATSIANISFKAERKDSLGDAGELTEKECNDLKISAYVEPTPSAYFLTPSSYGSGSGVWHGPSITREIPADEAGDVGAANFMLAFEQKTCIGNGKNAEKELGGFQVQLTDASGKQVAGARIFKTKAGNTAKVAFYLGGEKVYGTENRNISFANGMFGNDSGYQSSLIDKNGSKIIFNICGLQRTFTDSSLKNVAVRKITFTFDKYSTSPALSFNGLRAIKFVKNKCDTWENIPNKFSADDVVAADCKSGKVYLNNRFRPELGALGNDWEDFYLVPGVNQIGFAYSDWVSAAYAPTFKVRYREVYL